MLVLSRKESQTIRIGQDIVIKVVKTGKGTIKIGVEAPEDIKVARGELPFFESKSDLLEVIQHG